MIEFYLGIDVGYDSKRPSTGLCLLELNLGKLRWTCLNTHTDKTSRRNDLKKLIGPGTPISGVAIDGPLARDLRPVSDYRAADSLLARGAFQRRCKPGPTNSPTGQALNDHAIQLANIVLALMSDDYLYIEEATHPHKIHGRRIVEAFPNAFLGVLLRAGDFAKLPPRGQRFDYFWEMAVGAGLLEELIRHVAPQTVFDDTMGAINDHDHRAAFICALTALCITRNQYVAVGDPQNGQIILPPHGLWPNHDGSHTSWAEEALRSNVVGVHGACQRYPTHASAFLFSNGHSWLQ